MNKVAQTLALLATALAVILMPTISLLWYSLLVMFASSRPVRHFIARSAKWVDRCAGTVTILFGLKLLAQK